MQATAANSPKRTFTEVARRAQIVEAAIDTIAAGGYARASFTRIAKRAGLSSTGLISYHFAGRAELIGEVVAKVVGDIGASMAERMSVVDEPAAALRIYIEGNIEFIDAHRAEMKALLEIFVNGAFEYDTATDDVVVSPIEDILRAGQANGTFRNFDPKVMATLVQRSIEGLPFLLEREPHLDVAAYAAEVTTVFDLATRAER